MLTRFVNVCMSGDVRLRVLSMDLKGRRDLSLRLQDGPPGVPSHAPRLASTTPTWPLTLLMRSFPLNPPHVSIAGADVAFTAQQSSECAVCSSQRGRSLGWRIRSLGWRIRSLGWRFRSLGWRFRSHLKGLVVERPEMTEKSTHMDEMHHKSRALQ